MRQDFLLSASQGVEIILRGIFLMKLTLLAFCLAGRRCFPRGYLADVSTVGIG